MFEHLLQRSQEWCRDDVIQFCKVKAYLQRGWISYKDTEEGVRKGVYIISDSDEQYPEEDESDDEIDDEENNEWIDNM